MIHNPGPAERARSLAFGVADGTLATPDGQIFPVVAHTTDDNGNPLLLIPVDSPIVAALAHEPDVAGTLHVTDVTSVPLADRIRGQAWLHGWLTEVPADSRREAAMRISRLHPRVDLLDIGARVPVEVEQEWTVLVLEVAEVEIDDLWGNAVIEPEEYAAAYPDPFVALEPAVIEHLDADHRDELATLFHARFGDVVPRPIVRAIGLDRFGLRVRCFSPHPSGPAPFDLRFAFPEPAKDIETLRRAYRRMFSTAAKAR